MRPSAWAIAVAQADPAIPQPSRKMKTWFRIALLKATTAVAIRVTRGRPMPLKNPSTAQVAAPKNEPATRGNQKSAASCSPRDRARKASAPNGPQRPPESKEECSMRRPRARSRPPGCARDSVCAEGLRDDRLHSQTDAAEQHHYDDAPASARRDRGHRLSRNASDEPGVGEIQQRLDRAVRTSGPASARPRANRRARGPARRCVARAGGRRAAGRERSG